MADWKLRPGVHKYRKKPVVIEAIQFTDNAEEIIKWADGDIIKTEYPTALSIETAEGTMEAHVGDYIIKGVEGEIYPCSPSVFKKTYQYEASL